MSKRLNIQYAYMHITVPIFVFTATNAKIQTKIDRIPAYAKYTWHAEVDYSDSMPMAHLNAWKNWFTIARSWAVTQSTPKWIHASFGLNMVFAWSMTNKNWFIALIGVESMFPVYANILSDFAQAWGWAMSMSPPDFSMRWSTGWWFECVDVWEKVYG